MSSRAARSRRLCALRLAPALLAAGLAAAPLAARAEDDRHALGVELGVVGASVRDDLLVPLATSGGGLSLGLAYQGRLGPGRLDTDLRVGLMIGTDRVGALGGAFSHGAGLRYLLPAFPAGRWRVSLGPALGADVASFYLGDWDDAHLYWIGSQWLGLSARAWRPLGARWRLDTSADLALVGRVGRPPEYRLNKQDALDSLGFHVVDVFRGAEPVSIADWQLVRVRAEVSRSPAAGPSTSAWRFGLELRLTHVEAPATAFALESKLVAAKGWDW